MLFLQTRENIRTSSWYSDEFITVSQKKCINHKHKEKWIYWLL